MLGKKKTDKPMVVNEPINSTELERNASAKAPESATPVKGKNNKNEGRPNIFVRMFKRIGRAFMEMGSELKKVSWPTARKVVTSTGVVLMVVFMFFAVLTAFDFGLGAIFEQIVKL